MATYRERIEDLFKEKRRIFSLEDTQKESFIDWVLQRHTRLRSRDKKWITKHPEAEQSLPEAKEYFEAVFDALKNSNGKDFYTGSPLNWLISFNQDDVKEEDCKTNVRQERITFDHVNGRVLAKLKFVMCAGKTNDAKNDLIQKEFLDLCESVLKYHGYTVSAPSSISSGE